MNERQLSALRIWHETVTESEKEIDALVEIGFRTESRLCTAINNALEAITSATAQIVGDESGWLEWYWLDYRKSARIAHQVCTICEDCTHQYQAEMIQQSRCDRVRGINWMAYTPKERKKEVA